MSDQTLRKLLELVESNQKLFNEAEYIEICNLCRDRFIENEDSSSTSSGGEPYIGNFNIDIDFIGPPSDVQCTDNYHYHLEVGDYIKPIYDPLHPDLLGNTSRIIKISYLGFQDRRLSDTMDEPGYIIETSTGLYPALLVRKTSPP